MSQDLLIEYLQKLNDQLQESEIYNIINKPKMVYPLNVNAIPQFNHVSIKYTHHRMIQEKWQITSSFSTSNLNPKSHESWKKTYSSPSRLSWLSGPSISPKRRSKSTSMALCDDDMQRPATTLCCRPSTLWILAHWRHESRVRSWCDLCCSSLFGP